MSAQIPQADRFAELTLIPETFAKYSDPATRSPTRRRMSVPSGRIQLGDEFDHEAKVAALEAIGADVHQVLKDGLQLEMIGDGKAWLRWHNRRVLTADELAAFLKALTLTFCPDDLEIEEVECEGDE